MSTKKQIALKWGLGLAMVGILGFTIHYLMKQIRLLVDTDFELAGTKINKLSLKEINLTLWWKIINKSDITVSVSEQNYDLFLNGQFVKRVGYQESVQIHPRSDNRVPTVVSFTPKEAIKVGVSNFTSLLTKAGRSRLNLEVVGSMDIKTSIFELKKFPFEFKDNLQAIMDY